MSRFNFSFFTFLLCLGIFFATGLGQVFWSKWGWFPAYYLFLLSGFAVSCGYFLRKSSSTAPLRNSGPVYWSFLLFFTAFGFLTRFRDAGSIALWVDEDLQNWFVLRGRDLVHDAAYGQQPPLHHYLALFSLHLFGKSLFGLRFFTAAFGSLSVPLFFSLLWKTCRQKWLAVFSSIVFLAQSWMVSYSSEAKPYMAAVFFALLFLHAIYRLLEEGGRSQFECELICINTLFLLTVGVQPVLFTIGAVAVFAVIYRKDRKKAQRLILCCGSSFTLFFPFLVNIYVLSMSKNYIKSPFSSIVHLNVLAADFAYHGLLWFKLLGPLLFLFPLLVGFLLAYGFSRKSLECRWQAGVALLTFAFPLLVVLAHWLFISIEAFPSYSILLVPIAIAALAYSLDGICSALSVRRPMRTLIVGVMGSLCLGFSWSELQAESKKIHEDLIPDLYSYFKKADIQNAFAFYFTLNKIPENQTISPALGFPGKDYYYTPDLEPKVHLDSAWDVWVPDYRTQIDPLLDRLEQNPETSDIFFFYLSRDNESPLEDSKFPLSKPRITRFWKPYYGNWSQAFLFHLKNERGFRNTVDVFMQEVDRLEPRNDLKLKAYFVLMATSSYGHRCAEAFRYRKRSADLCVLARAGPDSGCRTLDRLDKLLKRECGSERDLIPGKPSM